MRHPLPDEEFEVKKMEGGVPVLYGRCKPCRARLNANQKGDKFKKRTAKYAKSDKGKATRLKNSKTATGVAISKRRNEARKQRRRDSPALRLANKVHHAA